MRNKLVETTAGFPVGEPGGEKLLEVIAGQYTGRLAALMATSGSDIKLSYSDSPYTSWSSPQTLVTDAADGSFDCCIEANGNIHLVYTEQSTRYLVSRRLTFSEGTWSVGSKVTAYNGTECYSTSVTVEPDGTLWVAYCQLSGSSKSVYVKSSNDSGASWGSGASDGGTLMGGTGMSVWSRVIVGLNDIFVFYTYTSNTLAVRTQPRGGGSWTSQYVVSTGSSLGRHFDVAVRADGLVAVVYAAENLYYRDYDGVVWSAAVQLDSTGLISPNVFFRDNAPIVVYLKAFQGLQYVLRQTVRRTGIFTTPVDLLTGARCFDSVTLYDSSSGSYADKTTEAISGTAADVYHPNSGCLVKDSGDQVFVGMDAKFRYAHFYLSTTGSGGTATFSYWNGATWQAFTPAGGASSLSNSDERVLLWNDFTSVPGAWQKNSVNSVSRYWIKIEVNSAFSTGPVATQVSAISEIGRLIVRR